MTLNKQSENFDEPNNDDVPNNLKLKNISFVKFLNFIILIILEFKNSFFRFLIIKIANMKNFSSRQKRIFKYIKKYFSFGGNCFYDLHVS